MHEKVVSKSVEWYTPAWIFEALGLCFDLDVCSPGADVVPWIPAGRCFVPPVDGLSEDWGIGSVWMNPPYGRGIVRWVERFLMHGNGVALLPSRTDTDWFQSLMPRSSGLLFLRGRVGFVAGGGVVKSGGNVVGSVLVACGWRCAGALRDMGGSGFNVRRFGGVHFMAG